MCSYYTEERVPVFSLSHTHTQACTNISTHVKHSQSSHRPAAGRVCIQGSNAAMDERKELSHQEQMSCDVSDCDCKTFSPRPWALNKCSTCSHWNTLHAGGDPIVKATLKVRGVLTELVNCIEESFSKLGVVVLPPKIEELGILVFTCMSGAARRFHTSYHVLGFLRSGVMPALTNPIQILAALFHDVVYFQVDQGFPYALENMLDPYIEPYEEGWKLRDSVDSKTREQKAYHSVRHVFNFKEGKKLATNQGMNEMLSALAMYLSLLDILPEKHLLAITACIEATVPFRSLDSEGKSPYDHLEQRLLDAGQSEEDAHEHTLLALRMANKDVEDFALVESGLFLNNTWLLLPEMNTSLRIQGHCSVSEYRRALLGNKTFMAFLTPETVFRQHRGVPSESEYKKLMERTRINLNTATAYLSAKLLAMGILEAAAQLSGGDVPLQYFVGGLIDELHPQFENLCHYLPHTTQLPEKHHDPVIWKLLDEGRELETSWDIKNSPLSFFVYRQMTAQQMEIANATSLRFFDNEITAQDFLKLFPLGVICPVLQALGTMAPMRGAAFRAISDSLKRSSGSEEGGDPGQ